MRSRSSAAALRLKVRTRIRSGEMPRRSIRSATAATIVVVLPVPGPASTSSGPPAWSTTCCCAWSRRGALSAARAGGRGGTRVRGAGPSVPIPADGTDISRLIRGHPACRGGVSGRAPRRSAMTGMAKQAATVRQAASADVKPLAPSWPGPAKTIRRSCGCCRNSGPSPPEPRHYPTALPSSPPCGGLQRPARPPVRITLRHTCHLASGIAGRQDRFWPLRRCAADRDRPAGTVWPGRQAPGAAMPARPSRGMTAAVAAR